MKKVMILGLVMFATALVAQEVTTPVETQKITKEYVKKAIKTDCGFDASCWVVIGIWLDLKTGTGSIMLDGYKDFASKEAGAQLMGRKSVEIKDITAMSSYPAVRFDLLTLLGTSETFEKATIEAVEVTIPKPTEDGAEATIPKPTEEEPAK